MRFDLSDEDWTLLEPLLPRSRKSARVDDRFAPTVPSSPASVFRFLPG